MHITIEGDAGELPAAMTTSLAVVLTELLQNVVDHAYPPGLESDAGHVRLELANDGTALDVRVVDDGAGLPEGFSPEAATGLGLSIVRTLVTTELDGTLDMHTGDGDGDRPGTVVALHLPIHEETEP